MAKRIKAQANETNLERAARLWMNDKGTDYSDGWRGAYKDLEYGGCSSGMVSDLIYYNDTKRFYARHRADISTLLFEQLDSTGFDGPGALFGDKWDKEDPLALEQSNQNLLAWFGFEESARNVAYANGYDN